MQALIYDPDQPRGLRLGEAAEPVATPGQALIDVRAVSLNFGELAYLAGRARPGEIPGWDAAGIVVEPAADGSGPPAGAAVVTFGWGGAWARRRAVDTAELAVLADSTDLGAAAALPVAGVTALRAVRRLGPIVGRRVLITGASGGVGRFAVQLAARAGAEVIACVGRPARGEGLPALGAAQVVVGLTNLTAPVFGVLDNVGGAQLAEAFRLVHDGGVALSIGMASREPTTIDFEQERIRGGNKRLETLVIGTHLGDDLAYLARLLASGELDPQIGWRGDWNRAPEAADALLSRNVAGKAILDLPT
ncbi:MAG: zinc-binding dehydrogenase [Frankia sp.]